MDKKSSSAGHGQRKTGSAHGRGPAKQIRRGIQQGASGRKPKASVPRSTARGSGRPKHLNFSAARQKRKMSATHHAAQPHKPVKRNDDAVHFVPLGGLEEIGRNCSFLEYKNEILVTDVGIQFPEEDTPGIDYIIPNAIYLESKKQNVVGIVLTHGHYDHIAAIHYLVEKFGNPVIYASEFTRGIVERRHTEFPNAPKLKFITVKEGSREHISPNFTAEFFTVEHTIPQAYGVIIETPVGNMVNFGDFRLDYDKDGTPRHLDVFERVGAKGVHTAFMDSTGADVAGHVPSEDTVEENLEKLIQGAKGRIMIATFASLVDRLLEIIRIAGRNGRKVAVNGRSMKDNLEIARKLGYMKDQKDVIIPLEEVGKYKDDKIVILTTGSQGEPNAGLMRIVNGEHKVVRFKPTDTVVFSSSVVPGNERSVQTLQDNIMRQVDELYNSKLLDIHASGHCYSEDIKLVIDRVKPKFIVPIHGYYFKRRAMQKLAESVGISRDRVHMMDNGQVAELTKDAFRVTDETVPAFYVMVDGLGVGDVEEVVLRDRRSLAQEGMVVIILTFDRHSNRLLRNPDIISRGFIYLKDNLDLLSELRHRLKNIATRLPNSQNTEADYIRGIVRDQVGSFLYNKTKRRPMILPVVIEV